MKLLSEVNLHLVLTMLKCLHICTQDFTKLLQLEEEHVQRQCEDIIALKPDVVITEKGVSDLAQHYLVKAGITAIRRWVYLHVFHSYN